MPYNGTVKLQDGVTQRGEAIFPLVDAKDVYYEDNETSDKKFTSVKEKIASIAVGNEGVGAKGSAEGAEIFNSYTEGVNYLTFKNIALGEYSHAEGVNTKAFGRGGHAEGVLSAAGISYLTVKSYDKTTNTIELNNWGNFISANNTYGISGPIDVIQLKTFQRNVFLITNCDKENKKIKIILWRDSDSETFWEAIKENSLVFLWLGEPMLGEQESIWNIAEGDNLKGDYSHAEGMQALAFGNYSHAEGWLNTVSGDASHVEGKDNVVIGDCAHAEGYNNYAIGACSSVHGSDTLAGLKGFQILEQDQANKTYTLNSITSLEINNIFSIVGRDRYIDYGKITAINETDKKITVDNFKELESEYLEQYYFVTIENPTAGVQILGHFSDNFAEGRRTNAIGAVTHAEGCETVALGDGSHAEGLYTKAYSETQHVQGKYNKIDKNDVYAHIVGNGTSDTARSNAHTIDWNGNAWFSGIIKIGGTGQEDENAKELVTKEYVDNKISSVKEEESINISLTYDGNPSEDAVWGKIWETVNYLVKVSDIPDNFSGIEIGTGSITGVRKDNNYLNWSQAITESLIDDSVEGIIYIDFQNQTSEPNPITRALIATRAGIFNKFKIYEETNETITISEPGVYVLDNTHSPTSGNDYTSSISFTAIVKGNSTKPENPIDYIGNEIEMFNRGICIGDSVTEGVFDKNDQHPVYKTLSYPHILQRISGIDITNAGISGVTSTQWYEASLDSSTYSGTWNEKGEWTRTSSTSALSYTGYDFAIIHLGINDIFQISETNTLDTVITAYETAIRNIITKLTTNSSGIKIFLCTIIPNYAIGTNWDTLNDKIKSLANELDSVFLIDLTQYSKILDGSNYEVYHPTKTGYNQLAKELYAMISSCINKNLSEFNNISTDILEKQPSKDFVTKTDIKSFIVDDLNTEASDKALSAKQGYILDNAKLNISDAIGQKGIADSSEIFNGGLNQASGEYSHAEGKQTKAVGVNSHVEGWQTETFGGSSHAEGSFTEAIGDNSHAEGSYTSAGANAFNIVSSDEINKTYTLASVEGLKVNDIYSIHETYNETYNYINYGKITSIDSVNKKVTVDVFAELHGGIQTFYITGGNGSSKYGETSVGACSHAEGHQTKAWGYNSHAEGEYTQALGDDSHAEGNKTASEGMYSHAEGNGTTAKGRSSHAEGEDSNAVGAYSHTEGVGTKAEGVYSHAEGMDTQANGIGSHTEGINTQANGEYSHAEGYGTIASGESQHVQGRYNVIDEQSDYLYIAGNGFGENDRSNAHTIDWSGAAWFAGDIKLGGTGYKDSEAKTVATTDITKNLSEIIGNLADLETMSQDTLVNAINEVKNDSGGSSVEIVDDLTSEAVDKALSAKQGKILDAKIIVTKGFGEGAVILNDDSGMANGNYSCVENNFNVANGDCSHAGGYGTQALSNSSFTHGSGTIAGSKAFKITAFDDTNKTYTLDSVEGLAIDDVFNLYLKYGGTTEERCNYGKITAIDTSNKKVTVNNYLKSEDTEQSNYFRIAEKPKIGTQDFGTQAFAEGSQTIASGDSSHAEGEKNYALGSYSHAEGMLTKAYSKGSHVEGYGTEAKGDWSHAEGYRTISEGTGSHVEGAGSKAEGSNSHAEGYNTQATGSYSHAEGYNTQAIGLVSHAEGSDVEAKGNSCHAEGIYTQAKGDYSHAEGFQTLSISEASSAHGIKTVAGLRGFVITNFNTTNNSYTLQTVEGLAVNDVFSLVFDEDIEEETCYNYGHITAIDTTNNIVTVDNFKYVSDAEYAMYLIAFNKPNIGDTDIGKYAFAEGNNTFAFGKASHSEGTNTIVYGQDQHVQGRYNLKDITESYAHIVGNGTSDTARSNAYTLDWSGNAWFAGEVTIGTNKYKLVSEEKVGDLTQILTSEKTTLVSIIQDLQTRLAAIENKT